MVVTSPGNRYLTTTLLLIMQKADRGGEPPPGVAGISAFPDHGILPKEETGATKFLERHPDYDGRGVVIAIMDTGVDPWAPGLQTTPEGLPKLIDSIDCSGSGDVDTSTVVEAQGDGTVLGLSGRVLTLNPDWVNPTGKWHLGVKRAYELYPGALKPRVKNERKKEFTLKHRAVEASLQRELDEWKASHPKPTSPQEIEALADLEARVSQLAEFLKSYDDPGPLHDVIVWHTGEVWEAAVDVSETGDLSKTKAMQDYNLRRDVSTFNSKLDNLNFCVNVYEEGNILSIVVDAGSHGTHVAGITAAYNPEDPSTNGLAPGAQLISLKIGDSRLGSMETGQSIVRAFIEAVRLKVDLINMSYGEAVSVNDTGRIMKLLEEVVNKHGIIFVGSASNNGPALSTLGAPAGSGTSTIGVGAYLTPSMMLAEYSLRKTFGGINFTWSSTGPAYDGMQGATVVAPGGAITSVPNWTLQKTHLMNGTSMASPNACGAIGLVLSGLKAQGIAYSPHLIRQAVQYSAQWLDHLHPLIQGRGLLQVQGTYDYVTKHYKVPFIKVPLRVTVAGPKSGRGIYLREVGETVVSRDFKVTVDPKFHEDALSADKVAFELRLALSVQGDGPKDNGDKAKTPSWVTIPEFFLLVNNGRTFTITVDASRLPVGLHFAKVVGHDTSRPELGPLFEVPITVVKPIVVDPDIKTLDLGTKNYTSGQTYRHFVVPPPGSTWMDMTLHDRRPVGAVKKEGDEGGADGSAIIIACQAIQLLPQTPFRDSQFDKYVLLSPGQSETFSMSVEEGVTVEIATAQYAIAEGSTTLGLDVEFRGIAPHEPIVTLQGGFGFKELRVESKIRDEELAPSAKLDKWLQKVVPSSSTIKPLGNRDILPDGRQIYQLLLEYKFNCPENEEVTPRARFLNGVLYDSPMEHQFFMVFDGNKKLLGSGDCWPDAVSCPKGDNLIRLSVRHDDLSLLQGLTGLVVLLERKIKKDIPVPEFATREDLMTKKGKFSARVLRKGHRTSFFLGEPSEKPPKGAKPGDVLFGSLTLEKASKDQPKSKRPRGYPLYYIVPPAVAENPPKPKATAPDERTEEEKLEEKVRETKVKHLSSITDVAAFRRLHEAVMGVEGYATHIPLLQTRLHVLDNEKHRQEHLQEVVEAAEAVIALVDTTQLALHFGVRQDEDDVRAAKAHTAMVEKKEALADALTRKARALFDLGKTGEEVAPVLTELARWDSLDQDKYARLVLQRDEAKGHLGLVLKLLNKLIGDNANPSTIPKEDLLARRAAVFEKLGWDHLVVNDKKWRVIDNPKSYTLF